MEIVDLSRAELLSVHCDWVAAGAPEGELLDFLQFDESPKISCCAVKENGTIVALFEKRDTLRAYKNMRILLAPQTEVAEGDYNTVSNQLLHVTDIVAEIFSHFISTPLDKRGVIKIWNERTDIHSILVSIAQYLENNYGSQYAVKIYRSWVEIKKKGEQS